MNIYLYRYALFYLPESVPFQSASAREDRGCGDLPLPHHWPSTPIAVMSVRYTIRCESVTLSDIGSWRYHIRVCDVMEYECVLVKWREMTWEDVRGGDDIRVCDVMKCEWDDVRWRERTWHDIIILAAASITMDTQCSSVRSRILVIIFKSFKWWHWDDVIFDCRVMTIASNCGSVSSWYWNVMVGCRFVTGRSHHLSLIQLTARWHHHHIIRSHHLSLIQLPTCISLHIITNSKPTKYHKLT